MEELLNECLRSIVSGQKPSAATFMKLHQQIYQLSNSTERSTLSRLFESTSRCLSQSVMESQLLRSQDPFIYQSESLLEAFEKLHQLDVFIQKLFKGRKWFLSEFGQVCTLGVDYFKRDVFPRISSEVRTQMLHTLQQQHMDVQDTHSSSGNLISILKSERTAIPKIMEDQYINDSVLYAFYNEEPLPRHRFTRTKNLLQYSASIDNMTQNCKGPSEVLKTNVHMNNIQKKCFLLENLLSEEECKFLIEESEKVGYESIETEFLKNMRDNTRILVISESLATVMWNRISRFFKGQEDIENMRPFGFNSQGKWTPVGLNPCFRFCKYTAPSVGFAPHRDANFVRNEEERSIFTLMFYLNDNFKGGTTNFLISDGGKLDETIQEETERGFQKVHELVPKPGIGIAFEHTILHEGSPLLEGVKYIVRTDIVFQRTENPDKEEKFRKDPNFIKMVQYYKDAADAECVGNVAKSSELYERALSIRQHVDMANQVS